MNKIALWISVGVGDGPTERAIIASYVVEAEIHVPMGLLHDPSFCRKLYV